MNPATPGADLTEDAVSRLENAANPRLQAVSEAMTRHMHAFVREVAPTTPEWLAAIAFLTRTGQMCTDVRQEFILLSDVLGVSMLIELINNQAAQGVTSNTVLGPFFVADEPIVAMGSSILKREEPGEPLTFHGLITDDVGAPLENARLDVWQTAPDGLYDVQDPTAPHGHLRGAFVTGADGRYSVRTVRPASYPIPDDGPVGQWLRAVGRHPWRPAHTHFLIRKEGLKPLTTHLFIGGDPYLRSDAVFGVRPDLVVEPIPGPDGLEVRFDFGLKRLSA